MAETIFKEIVHKYGSVNKGVKIPFTFELKSGVTEDQIEYIWADCGSCTSWTWNNNSNTITGQLDTNLVTTKPDGEPTVVTKIVYVKTRTGDPYFTGDKDGTKTRIVHTNSGLERLQITGIVTSGTP